MNKHCSINQASQTLGKKWAIEIIYYLGEPKRFCELQNALGGINPATLSTRLKDLEQARIIRRYELTGVPRHVEYDLTDRGLELIPLVRALAEWAQRWYD
jgi:DNA-binding HxlR family transcriptional regulator